MPFGNKRIYPDAVLEQVLGKEPITPAQMNKKMWEYIKKHNLFK